MNDRTSSERWLPIPGWEGSYEISDLGRLRSLDRQVISAAGRTLHLKGRQLRGHLREQRGGSRRAITLHRPGQREHWFIYACVLTAFVGPRPEGYDARHLDGNSDNNVLANLAWGTRKENVQDMLRHGTNARQARRSCPRDHPLVSPNLVPSKRNGGRECLACQRAGSRARKAQRQGLLFNFRDEADREYEALMRSPGKKVGGIKGERAHNALLTETAVREMRAQHALGVPTVELARQYGVAKVTATKAISGANWAHVS